MSDPTEALTADGADGVHALHQLLRRAVTHFFPGATLTIGGPAAARLQRAPIGAQYVQFALANVLTLPSTIVQSVARIDGAVVARPTGELIAVGAILKGVGGITGIEGAHGGCD